MEDDPKVRKAFGYALYSGVAYQDGDGTNAPTLIYADADYAAGDGKCGLHESGKAANEPTIVYVRADAYVRALDEIERLRSENFVLREMQRQSDIARADIFRATFPGMAPAKLHNKS